MTAEVADPAPGPEAMQPATHVYGEPRQDWLDWLRGAAILMVLSSHYQIDWHNAGIFLPVAALAMRVGWSGVDMFFVISGFLVGGLLISEAKRYGRLDFRRFYLRRITKIWPPLYCVPLVYIVLMAAWGQPVPTSAKEMWPIFLHIQNYVPTPLGHMWSLAVEEHFYLLLPLLITAVGLNSGNARVARFQKVLLALILAVTLVRIVSVGFGLDPRTARILTHLRIDALLAGVFFATIYHFQVERWSAILKRPGLLVLLAIGAAWPFVLNPNTSRLFAGIGYFSLIVLYSSILLATARAGQVWNVRNPLLAGAAFIGRYSYPIYLFHPFVWKILHRWGLGDPEHPLLIAGSKSVTWILGLVTFFAISIVIGVAFGAAIERPLLKLRNVLLPPRSLSLER